MRPGIAFCCVVFCCAAAAVAIQETQKQLPSTSTVQKETRPKSNPIPDRFINLQVLPKDIPKPQLVGVMKQFCITFDVRCSYCHAVSDDLTQGVFDSDEKETKRKARALLKLIYDVKWAQGEKPEPKGN
jgi:hypothetical protein